MPIFITPNSNGAILHCYLLPPCPCKTTHLQIIALLKLIIYWTFHLFGRGQKRGGKLHLAGGVVTNLLWVYVPFVTSQRAHLSNFMSWHRFF